MIYLPTVTQKTDAHCGPAVLELLYSYVYCPFGQDQIVAAAGVADTIEEIGTPPAKLAQAVRILTPDLRFWFKQHATVHDLQLIVERFHWPVAINWQGLFYDTPEEQQAENPDGDHGHYSVVTGVDVSRNLISIADTYADYSSKPRRFSLDWFQTRWWDSTVDTARIDNDAVSTDRFMFVVTQQDAVFPQALGMRLPHELHILKM